LLAGEKALVAPLLLPPKFGLSKCKNSKCLIHP
jgi:hypothetical protein